MSTLPRQYLILGLLLGTLCGGAFSTCWGQATANAQQLRGARQLELAGNYAEALEQYESLGDEPAAKLGAARCLVATGQRDAAEQQLKEAQITHPSESRLLAARAQLAWERGDGETAEELAQEAVRLDDQSVPARWVLAELLRQRGQLDEALAAYGWFVEFYNAQSEIAAADDLRLIGRGAAQFARWKRLSEQFRFLVNDLYQETLSAEQGYWPADYEAGLLFLEKFNQAEAVRSFQAALKLNPQAAEVYAALGNLALQNYELDRAAAMAARSVELNPELAAGYRVLGDVELKQYQAPAALEYYERARALNPRDEETLGRIAAALIIIDGPSEAAGTRLATLLEEVQAQNPRPGLFYSVLAETLDGERRFDHAEVAYQRALAAMPQLLTTRGNLGMMYMRMGREAEATALLDESFDDDPFNVRVNNTLKVLEVLSEYETRESEHFIVRYDPRDKILARYLSRYLEQIYPELCAQLGYTPTEKSLFELFRSARNTDGHGWFSARVLGIPYVGTVAACAGGMVAMTSPTEGDRRYHWARVAKHEFVHVINLQQTGYKIPHWFTEALAVQSEGFPRPYSWNQMLARRVPRGEVIPLAELNLAFIRPRELEDRTMAYCQSEIYAEYMQDHFGEDAIARLLAAFATTSSTPDAVQQAFGMPVEQFEAGYMTYLQEIVAELGALGGEDEAQDWAALEQAHQQDSTNADVAARLAVEYLARREYPRARQLAQGVLLREPGHQLATYVIARLHVLVGDAEQALLVLEECLDREAPQPDVLTLLAALRSKGQDHAAAAELYELGRRQEPWNPRWLQGLARTYLAQQNSELLRPVLEELALLEAENVLVRKKLAQLAIESENSAAAVQWAWEAIYADCMDTDAHYLAAEAQLLAADYPAAAEELGVILLLAGDGKEVLDRIAGLCRQAKDPAALQAALEHLLDTDPEQSHVANILLYLEQ